MIRTTDQARTWDYTPFTGFFSTTPDSTTFPWRGHWFPVIQGGAEEDSDSDDTGDDTEDENSDDTGDDTSGGDEGGDKTFTQDDVNKLIAKAVSKKTRGKLDPKELGFETAKELNEFLAAARAKQTDDQSEAERALEAAKKEAADTARKEVLSKADERLIYAEFKLQAADAGIRKDAVADAFLIAQRLGDDWAVEVNDDDGEVTGIDEDLFVALKERKPYLFSSEEEDEEGAGDIGAGAGKNKGKKNSADALKAKYPALGGIR